MNEQGYMPNLPVDEQNAEQRKVIKFWVDHCAGIEKENASLKNSLNKFIGACDFDLFGEIHDVHLGDLNEAMKSYRDTQE